MLFLLQCVFHVRILRHELRHSSYQISYWRVRDASFVGLDFRVLQKVLIKSSLALRLVAINSVVDDTLHWQTFEMHCFR